MPKRSRGKPTTRREMNFTTADFTRKDSVWYPLIMQQVESLANTTLIQATKNYPAEPVGKDVLAEELVNFIYSQPTPERFIVAAISAVTLTAQALPAALNNHAVAVGYPNYAAATTEFDMEQIEKLWGETPST